MVVGELGLAVRYTNAADKQTMRVHAEGCAGDQCHDRVVVTPLHITNLRQIVFQLVGQNRTLVEHAIHLRFTCNLNLERITVIEFVQTREQQALKTA